MFLLLASNSPRRKQLLALGGWSFRVNSARVDERPHVGEEPRAYVLRMAESKARKSARAQKDEVVLAADTTVMDGERILGKPSDAHEAESMLLDLRGRTHRVLTALAVLLPGGADMLTDCCVTEVPMREYSLEEMRAYIASGDPLDKAGAYAIQHSGFHPVENLSGCYANVMGLPLCHLTRTFAKIGLEPLVDIAEACQTALAYNCPIHAQILRGEM